MRLTVLGPGHPFRGGIARTTTALVAALECRGHQPVFLTPIRQYPGWLYPGGRDRDPDACARLDCAEEVLDPLNPLSWPRTRRRAVMSKGEVWVLPYWTWAWSGLWLHLLATRRRPPVVGLVHNPADHDAGVLQRLAARLVLRRCQGLFTHGRSLARVLENLAPEVPLAFHPLAVDAPTSLPDRSSARENVDLAGVQRVALFAGFIRPYKGVDVLLDAVAKLPADASWSVVVAGEPWGGLEEELQRQVSRLQLSARVQLRFGWVAENELLQLLAAADLVVLPYRSGSQSAVAPMALSLGVPVLSTHVGALAEVVQDGVNGVIVEPGSSEALAAALARLDESTLERLAEGARESAKRLTWHAYAEAFEGLLERVVVGASE